MLARHVGTTPVGPSPPQLIALLARGDKRSMLVPPNEMWGANAPENYGAPSPANSTWNGQSIDGRPMHSPS